VRVLVSSYHFLVGPAIALAALGVIILICRWVFATPARPAVRLPETGGDFGLLEPVSTVRTADDAQMLRELLRSEGIRSTVTEAEAGYAVLVFARDARRARDLVRS
jgi:hypothetical protein